MCLIAARRRSVPDLVDRPHRPDVHDHAPSSTSTTARSIGLGYHRRRAVVQAAASSSRSASWACRASWCRLERHDGAEGHAGGGRSPGSATRWRLRFKPMRRSKRSTPWASSPATGTPGPMAKADRERHAGVHHGDPRAEPEVRTLKPSSRRGVGSAPAAVAPRQIPARVPRRDMPARNRVPNCPTDGSATAAPASSSRRPRVRAAPAPDRRSRSRWEDTGNGTRSAATA